MRWNAEGIVEAAQREHLALPDGLDGYAARVVRDTGHLPVDAARVGLRPRARPGRRGGGRASARPAAGARRRRPRRWPTCRSWWVGRRAAARHGRGPGRTCWGRSPTDHAGGWKVPAGRRAGDGHGIPALRRGAAAAGAPRGGARRWPGRVVGGGCRWWVVASRGMSRRHLPKPRLDLVVLDCPDALELARFYAEVLGWELEDDSDQRLGHPGAAGRWADPRQPRRADHPGLPADRRLRPADLARRGAPPAVPPRPLGRRHRRGRARRCWRRGRRCTSTSRPRTAASGSTSTRRATRSA